MSCSSVRQAVFSVSDGHTSSGHTLPIHPLHHVHSVPVITSLENTFGMTRHVPSIITPSATTPSSVASPMQHTPFGNSLGSSRVWQSRRDPHFQLGWSTQPAVPSAHILQPTSSGTVLDVDPMLLLERPANPAPQLTDSCVQPVMSMQPISLVPSAHPFVLQSPYSLSHTHLARNSAFQPCNFSHM